MKGVNGSVYMDKPKNLYFTVINLQRERRAKTVAVAKKVQRRRYFLYTVV